MLLDEIPRVPNVVDEDGTLVLRGPVFIQDSEFEMNKLIKKVIIGNSIGKIPNRAFFGCSNLESVIFEEPSQVTTLEYFCFRDCLKLTTIDLPSSIQEIGHLAFGECPLETIILRGSCFFDMSCFMTNFLTYLHIENPKQQLTNNAFDVSFSLPLTLSDSFSKAPCKIYIGEGSEHKSLRETIMKIFGNRPIIAGDIVFTGNELTNGPVLK